MLNITRLSGLFDIQDSPTVWQEMKELNDVSLVESGRRYGAWIHALQRQCKLPTEFVLPQIKVQYKDMLPYSMRQADERYSEAPELAHELSKQNWGYYFYLGNNLSTMDTQPNVRIRNRASSIYRMQAINGVLDNLCGSDKNEMSVLDFACNWGGIAIDMALRGFGSVTAFDIKKENIDRAKKLASYMKADVDFNVDDVYSIAERYGNQFDIVLNLGLLYHVTDPVELASVTYQLTRHIAVFDTLAHKEPFSGYIQAYVSETAIKRSGMGTRQIELHPTYRGLIDLIHFVGFKDLVEIVPVLGPEFPEREKDHYFQGHRRTIIAFK